MVVYFLRNVGTAFRLFALLLEDDDGKNNIEGMSHLSRTIIDL